MIYARYATEVKFQQCNRPSGNMSEGKVYFSVKHKLYGYKVEVSVLPSGLAIGCTKHYPGSISDLEIFRNNSGFHEEASKKVVVDQSYDDNGLHEIHRMDYWGILADKGYQGASEDFRVIHPIKNPPRGVLSTEDQEFNRKVSSDRIIVENYFGRMTSLFTVLSHKYRWNEKLYDKIFKACMALTNFHIKLNPLRNTDGFHYTGVRNRLCSTSLEESDKRKRSYEKSIQRRRQRMRTMTPRVLFEESDSS